MAHRIRLREPWGRRPEENKAAGEVHEVTFERRFNRPTGLEPNDQVEVEVNAATGCITEVRLNLVRLGDRSVFPQPTHRLRLEMTEQLESHNLLEVRLCSGESEPDLGEVNLWITSQKNS